MEELGPTAPYGFGVQLQSHEIPTWFRCQVCGVLRVVVVSELSGAITYSKYANYPTGYKWDQGYAAPTKAERRLEYLRAREGRGTVTPIRREVS